jgi:hypothetical protein
MTADKDSRAKSTGLNIARTVRIEKLGRNGRGLPTSKVTKPKAKKAALGAAFHLTVLSAEPPITSSQQQRPGFDGKLFFVLNDDGDFPAFAGPHPRLGDRHQGAHPVHPDGLIFPFRHDHVRHATSPYARDNWGDV